MRIDSRHLEVLSMQLEVSTIVLASLCKFWYPLVTRVPKSPILGSEYNHIVSFFFDGSKPVRFFELCVFDFEILILGAQRTDLDVQTYF